MTESKITTILFDLDGTILNTNNLVIKAFQYSLKEHLNIDVDDKELERYFGEPLLKTFKRYYLGNPTKLIQSFRDFDLKNHDKIVEFFPHVTEVIKTISERGFRIGIVTSKHRYMASKCSHLEEIEKYIEVINTFDDVEHPKPNPEPIQRALLKLGETPNHALMVGDSREDIISAKKAGVKSILVSWSVLEKDRISIQPDFIIEKIDELLQIILENRIDL